MISLRTMRSGLLMLCAVCAVSAFAGMVSPASATTAPEPDATTEAAPSFSKMKVRVLPGIATHGKTIAIRGASGSAGRKPVALLFRSRGTTVWHRLKTVTTDPRGFYDTDVTARQSGQFKVSSPSGQASPVRRLRVRSTLKVTGVDRYVKLGQNLGIRGVVRPKGQRRIKIVIKGAGETIRTRTKANGGFAVRWTPKRSGSFKVRVFSADNSVAIGDESRRFKVVGLRPSGASYYGPGLYGNGVACGGTLMPGTIGVANKTLPCGTKVTIRYHGRTVVAPVIDRGPYIAGRDYDLTEATRNRLGFGGVGTIWTDH